MSAGTTRGRRLAAGVSVVTIAAGVGAFAVLGVEGSSAQIDDAGREQGDPVGSTAAVTRRDLEEHAELNGTLGYGDQTDITRTGGGTITALPGLGTVVDRGGTILEVDGRPVPLWFGDRPLWRGLDGGATDGADVQQVEENLVALGFATPATLTVDHDWTTATTRAVKAWQESLGLTETGVIAPGDVIMLAGPVRIAGHPTAVGGPADGPVATVTGAARLVTIDLDASKQRLVSSGQSVEVVLPDGSALDATVSSVGTVAEGGDDPVNPSTPTIEVTVVLADDGQAGVLDEAPVTVRVVTSAAEDVLAVPVDALLALAEGGYAVERVTRTGTELVAVETGAFADGWVAVTGEVTEGDEVVVPA